MTDPTYVAYSDEVEQRRPNEDELIDEVVESLKRSNEEAYGKYKHGIRDAHAKSHGVLRGELTVNPDLDIHLRQGLFGTPATYPVIARLSTGFGEIRSDRIHFARGIAHQVLGVHGPWALPGVGRRLGQLRAHLIVSIIGGQPHTTSIDVVTGSFPELSRAAGSLADGDPKSIKLASTAYRRA